jgi:hypothetical protein
VKYAWLLLLSLGFGFGFGVASCTQDVNVGANLAPLAIEPDAGLAVWAEAAGGPGDDRVWSLDVGNKGVAYVTGTFATSLTYGAVTHDVQGADGDVYIAELRPDQTPGWLNTYSGSLYTFSEHVAVAGPRLHTLGIFHGELTTPQGVIDSGDFQALVLFTHQLDGEFVSSVHVSGSRNVQGKLVRLSPDGERLLVVGNYVGVTDFGQGPLAETPADLDYGLVAVYTSGDQPELLWAAAIPGDNVLAQGGTFGPDGSIYVSGSYRDSLEIGTDAQGHGDSVNGFLARLDGAGQPQWVNTLSGPGEDAFEHVELTERGTLVVVGTVSPEAALVHQGAENPVALATVALNTAGSTDALVASFSTSGELLWHATLGGSEPDLGHGIAVAPERVVVCGSFSGTASFGGEARTSVGGEDAFIVSFDASGEVVSVQTFGGPGDDELRDVAWDPLVGGLVAGGAFTETLEVGTHTLVSQGGSDLWLLRF